MLWLSAREPFWTPPPTLTACSAEAELGDIVTELFTAKHEVTMACAEAMTDQQRTVLDSTQSSDCLLC